MVTYSAISPSITEAFSYTSITLSLEGIIILKVMLTYFPVVDCLSEDVWSGNRFFKSPSLPAGTINLNI